MATVKWAHPHSIPNRHVVGVEFERLTNEQLDLIDRMQIMSAAPATK